MKYIKLFEDYKGDDKYVKNKLYFVIQDKDSTFITGEFIGENPVTSKYKKDAKKFKTRKDASSYFWNHREQLGDFKIEEIF